MKAKAIVLAALIAPLAGFTAITPFTNAAHNKPVSSELIVKAQATGKMILIGNAPFGDRHVAAFLDRNFVIQEPADQGETAFLLYNTEGTLVHRVVGDVKYPYELAVKIKRGLNASTQYYTLLDRFESGDLSMSLLESAIVGATDANDHVAGKRLMQAYLSAMTADLTASQLSFVGRHTRSTADPGFACLLGNGQHTDKLVEIIFAEEYLSKVGDKHADASLLSESVKAKYPSDGLEMHIDRMAIEWLEMREDREPLKTAAREYVDRYKNALSTAQVRYYSGLVK